MPNLSLVVCVYREREFLARLLRETNGVFDDLVVIHDGSEHAPSDSPQAKVPAIDFASESSDHLSVYRQPGHPPAAGSMHAMVVTAGGRFFEGPRSFQQEPHWPFGWAVAKHDWILRFDADEFPSAQLKEWLEAFRRAPDPDSGVSGYTCIWPLWNGRRAVTAIWPTDRIFLFHRYRVRFPAMVEQVPIPDARFEEVSLILHHQPKRKSFGIRNLILRRQAYRWRRVIAESLLKPANELPRWRWSSTDWPPGWEEFRRAPLRAAFSRLVLWPRPMMRIIFQNGLYRYFYCIPFAGLHHFLIGWVLWLEMRKRALARLLTTTAATDSVEHANPGKPSEPT